MTAIGDRSSVVVLLAYPRQWSESQRRLDIIDERGLAAQVDALAGSPAFLAAVRKAHAVYGEVLGITEAQALPTDPVVFDAPTRALRATIQAYVTRLIGTADEDDEAIAALRKALLPIDALRAESSGSKASATPEPVEPAEPEPEPEPAV